jgi:hypothetical protein
LATNPRKPDRLALVVGHAIVGAVATTIALSVLKGQKGAAMLVGAFVVVAHHQVDAPVSRAVAELGI